MEISVNQGMGCLTQKNFQVWFTVDEGALFELFGAYAEETIARQVALDLASTGLIQYAEIREIKNTYRTRKRR